MVAGRSEQSRLKRDSNHLQESSSFLLDQAQVIEVLTELYILIEQYAPAWYAQERHEKIARALHILKKC